MDDGLLVAARRLLELDEPSAQLGALLLVHAALESNLNDLGESVAPEAWRDERAFFTRTPHRGTLGKLNFLWERAFGSPPDWGRRPHQSLKRLDAWRNRLAHSGPDRETTCIDKPDLQHIAEDVAEVAAVLEAALHR